MSTAQHNNHNNLDDIFKQEQLKVSVTVGGEPMPDKEATKRLRTQIFRHEQLGLPFIYEGVQYTASRKVNRVTCKKVYNQQLPTTVHLLDGVTHIASEAFRYREELEYLFMPSSVIWIGVRAFMGTNLRRLKVSPNVTQIGTSCFESCEKLEYLDMRIKATYTPGMMCFNCPSLKEVWLSPNLLELDTLAFTHCPSLETVHLPHRRIANFAKLSKDIRKQVQWVYY